MDSQLVSITITLELKNLIDGLRGKLSYTQFLEPLVEKDTE